MPIRVARPPTARWAAGDTGERVNDDHARQVEDDLRVRVHAIIRAGLRGDVEGLVSLAGDDSDELLPVVTRVLTEALLQLVPREEIERQLDEWFTVRASRLAE
jgi:hypothetical protein